MIGELWRTPVLYYRLFSQPRSATEEEHGTIRAHTGEAPPRARCGDVREEDLERAVFSVGKGRRRALYRGSREGLKKKERLRVHMHAPKVD